MIKTCRKPCSCAVAVITLIGTGYMAWRFSCCLGAIVTADATAGYRRMIHECDDGPAWRNMTVRTLASRQNMIGRLGGGTDEITFRVTARTR